MIGCTLGEYMNIGQWRRAPYLLGAQDRGGTRDDFWDKP